MGDHSFRHFLLLMLITTVVLEFRDLDREVGSPSGRELERPPIVTYVRAEERHVQGYETTAALLTPQEIADHMNFLMLAAHDTLASSLTAFVYFLAKHRNWQEALRDEARALGLAKREPLPYERLQDMPLTEMAFNECLRLIPPVPSVLRCATRDVKFGGFVIPAAACVNINPLYTHYMSKYWPNPEKFDPLRFSAEAVRSRPKYAFVPFGGGAHMCLGLNFAYMQAKCFAYQLLSALEVSIDAAYKPEWSYWPIPRPRDGLRIHLASIH
jgi:cytochrome P450